MHSHNHHGHDHAHTHEHHHHHGHSSHERVLSNLKVSFWLNFIFSMIEFVGGFLTNSVAIQSDAVHDLGDSLSLAFAWFFEKIAQRPASLKLSFGYLRLRIFGALFTGGILFLGSLLMLFRSIERLFNPQPIEVYGMLGLAGLGVLVNLAAFFKMRLGKTIIERTMMIHLLEDAAGWIFVFIGAIILSFDGPLWVDSVLSIGLSVWVLYRVFNILKEALWVLLQGVPGDSPEVFSELKKVAGVLEIHHLHHWSLDGQNHILSAHIVIADDADWSIVEHIKKEIRARLKQLGSFEITLEFERTSEKCLSPHHVF